MWTPEVEATTRRPTARHLFVQLIIIQLRPMPRDPTRQQVSAGLQYVAQKPAFLQNFGHAPVSPPPGRRGESSRAGAAGQGGSGREPLPERPREGEWAKGSDDEGGDEEDEWEQMYGGGDDGPQVVVLKQGRHLDADQLRRERNRGERRQAWTLGIRF